MANTRPKVSCDGIPFGRARNSLNHCCLERPYSVTWVHDSAPLIIAQRAIKAYPEIGLVEKIVLAIRVYGRLVADLAGVGK